MRTFMDVNFHKEGDTVVALKLILYCPHTVQFVWYKLLYNNFYFFYIGHETSLA